jgi:hypothetical protein
MGHETDPWLPVKIDTWRNANMFYNLSVLAQNIQDEIRQSLDSNIEIKALKLMAQREHELGGTVEPNGALNKQAVEEVRCRIPKTSPADVRAIVMEWRYDDL